MAIDVRHEAGKVKREPLVPIPAHEELSPAFQERSRRAIALLGVPINSVLAFAHAEDLGGAARDFFSAAMTLGSLSRELRLLIRLAVSNTNECRYCQAHQRHQLTHLRVAETKLAAVGNGGEGLEPREQAAVRFAQAMTFDAGNIPDAVADAFVAQFSPQERIEVAIVAATMGMLNKCNDALRVPLEAEFEPLVS